MNVRMAAQVLSSTDSNVLLKYGDPEVLETAQYCDLIDQLFDIMNIRNCDKHTLKRKPFLKPFSSVNDERFTWLQEKFLDYLSSWKKSIENRPGPFSDTDKANKFISRQTYEGIRMTTSSMIACIKFLLNNGIA